MVNSVFDEILSARNAVSLFGEDKREGKKVYLKLVRRVHPDMLNDSDKTLGSEAFNKLRELYEEYLQETGDTKAKERRTQSSFSVDFNSRVFVSSDTNNLSTDKGFLVYDGVLTGSKGDIKCRIHSVSSPDDNSLLENSLELLKKVTGENEKIKHFYSNVIASDTKGSQVKYVEDNFSHGNWVSLEEVSEIFPDGLDGRNTAWIFKRLLVALCGITDSLVVHGCVTPDSVMVEPAEHKLVLTNWHYAVKEGSKLSVAHSNYRDFYPDSVFDKKPADHNVDVYIAANTILKVLGDTSETKLRAFFEGCKFTTTHPIILLQELDDLLFEIYGPAKFVSFKF